MQRTARGAGGSRSGRLTGPVDVALARASETIPQRLTGGGLLFSLKWDGYRLVIVRGQRSARLWSRQGTDLSAAFPEIVDAAIAYVPPGCVLDGEVVILDPTQGRTDFRLLGHRLGAGPRTVAGERRAHPASWVGFDLLAVAGMDVRPQPLGTRHRLLVELAADWAPPLQLCPTTSDHATAVEWMNSWAAVGVEGIVSKELSGPYLPGARDWVKTKHRSTIDVVVGGLVGTWRRPSSILGGRYDASGRLRIVAHSAPLSVAAAAELVDVLAPARSGHPWPDTVSSHRFGADRVPLVRVDPLVVAEVAVDAAHDGGVWRHPARWQRTRPDLRPSDVPLWAPLAEQLVHVN